MVLLAKGEHGSCPLFVELSTPEKNIFPDSAVGWVSSKAGGFCFPFLSLFPASVNIRLFGGETLPWQKNQSSSPYFLLMEACIKKVNKASVFCSVVPKRLGSQPLMITGVTSNSRSGTWEPSA